MECEESSHKRTRFERLIRDEEEGFLGRLPPSAVRSLCSKLSLPLEEPEFLHLCSLEVAGRSCRMLLAGMSGLSSVWWERTAEAEAVVEMAICFLRAGSCSARPEPEDIHLCSLDLGGRSSNKLGARISAAVDSCSSG